MIDWYFVVIGAAALAAGAAMGYALAWLRWLRWLGQPVRLAPGKREVSRRPCIAVYTDEGDAVHVR